MADRNQLLNDSEETFRIAFEGQQSGMWTAIPAQVVSVDLTNMVISAQPLIQGIVEDENGNKTFVALPVLIHVPITFPCAGGFILTFPIAPGDEVLIIFASRCIDAWWQLGGVQRPMELRMHDLSDGFAIPGPRSVPNAVPAINSSDCQLRNTAGTTYVSITADGKITLVAPSEIDIQATNVNLTGTLNVTGDVDVTGNVNATAEITAQTLGVPIPLSTHLHPGVTSGSSDTGAPIP
jgi:hypothetical protein